MLLYKHYPFKTLNVNSTVDKMIKLLLMIMEMLLLMNSKNQNNFKMLMTYGKNIKLLFIHHH